jgi:small-conductance mechanosensitive channel
LPPRFFAFRAVFLAFLRDSDDELGHRKLLTRVKRGTILSNGLLCAQPLHVGRRPIVGGLIYLIGLIVVILFILSFLGLR